MAKKAAAKKKTTDKAVAVVPDSEVIDQAAMDRYATMGGAGQEEATASDFQVPMLYIAQSNSPCVDKDEDAYIEEVLLQIALEEA